MQLKDLHWEGGGMTVLKDSDHLLRRFGHLKIIHLAAGETMVNQGSQIADQLWTVLEGKGKWVLEDAREDSPSFSKREERTLDTKEPKLLLIPFGLRYSILVEGKTVLLQLSTH